MQPRVWEREQWLALQAHHQARVAGPTEAYLARQAAGTKHPVDDFLFEYYFYRPRELQRWHPGAGVVLLDAPEFADRRGYALAPEHGEHAYRVAPGFIAEKTKLLRRTIKLLSTIAARPGQFGCFGLHEWAMVYRDDAPRHDVPLRLGAGGTDQVVEAHQIACSHFDAFRFFTPPARPLNQLQPRSDTRLEMEQPGCLHVGMDLYKHAFRLSPIISAELVADAFELASRIRTLDMRASPYDLSSYGYTPVAIETPEGKAAYVAAQRRFSQEAAPLRERLVQACEAALARL